MTGSEDSAFLAIDGGGTHCRFLLVQGGARWSATGGTANVSTDFEAACGVLQAGIADLGAQSGAAVAAILHLPAFVGLAGVTGPEMIARLEKAVPLTRVRFADDRPAALRGALGSADGYVAHCGTGSFFAAQIGGQQRLTGGWGSVLGDEASAMWIGKRLLSRTLRCEDGFQDHSPLTRAMLDHHGGPTGIVRFAATAGPSGIGVLAPRVTEAAAAGDPIATSLMSDAGACVAAELTGLGWTPDLPICLTGGIGPHYAAFLPGGMRDALQAPRGTPLDGAEALARELADEVRA